MPTLLELLLVGVTRCASTVEFIKCFQHTKIVLRHAQHQILESERILCLGLLHAVVSLVQTHQQFFVKNGLADADDKGFVGESVGVATGLVVFLIDPFDPAREIGVG